MVKSGGNSIDMSRDPRRQPLPKRPEPSAVADRIGTVKKTKKVSPKPSSKSDSKATTAVPSAAERSNQESKTKVATVGSKEKKSLQDAVTGPSTSEQPKSRSRTTKAPTPNESHATSTSLPPVIAQTDYVQPITPERSKSHHVDGIHAKNAVPSPQDNRPIVQHTPFLPKYPNCASSTEPKSSQTTRLSQKRPRAGVQQMSLATTLNADAHKKKLGGEAPSGEFSTKGLSAQDYAKVLPPQKPNPVYTDTSERLRRDSAIEKEYVKGIGEVVIRHGPEVDGDLKPATPRHLEDESFAGISYCTKLRSVDAQYMKWVLAVDGFKIILNASETITIPATAISMVLYNIDCRKFYLSTDKSAASAARLEESILEVGGDQDAPSKLRSLFERRLSGLKVHKVEPDFFHGKEHDFQRSNIGTLPLRSTPQPDGINPESSDGIEESVMKDLKLLKDVVVVQNRTSQAPGILQQTAKSSDDKNPSQIPPQNDAQMLQDSDSDDEDNQSILPISQSYAVAPAKSVQRKRKAKEPSEPHVASSVVTSRRWLKGVFIEKTRQVDHKQGGKSHAWEAPVDPTQRAPPTSCSPVPQVADGTSSLTLYYNSKERVRRNDLVIRIREPASVDGGQNKHDKLDVYDGPFRISRLPKGIASAIAPKNTEELMSGEQILTPPLERTESDRMKETLVKLDFPTDKQAQRKPNYGWTKLGRLRPVYKIRPETEADCDARTSYYQAEAAGGTRTILNTTFMENETGDVEAAIDVQGVCRVQRGAYVKVTFIASEGLEGDSIYEVEKLRGKRIDRHSRKEYPDEEMTDPRILRYLEEGGQVDKSEVLVVKYLVHWAGWPSEDDTWERAQDNIPVEFVNDYNTLVDDHDVVIAEPPNKRRKSIAKKLIKGA